MRLNSKVMDSLFWEWKAQVRVLSVLYLSYCLLLAPRLTVIQHKNQYKNTWKMSGLVGKEKHQVAEIKVGASRAEVVVSVFSMFGETPCMLLWDSRKGA